MKVMGLISGTSHDGIDVAVVDFTEENSDLHGSVLYQQVFSYPSELRARLLAALPPAPTTLAEIAELDTLIGQAFAAAARTALETVGEVDLICSHGQTVYHWVTGDQARGTLQIGQPAWIAETTGAPVVSDVRIRDITAGGHGAPLVPMLDLMLLRGRGRRVGALNLGGIANLSVVTDDSPVIAYDVGPANALIDAVVVERGLNDLGYDAGGTIAASGRIDSALLDELLADPYYGLAAPKSSGKEHFNADYVRQYVSGSGREIGDRDLVATLTELTVRTVVAAAAAHELDSLLIAGGGSHNPVLCEGIAAGLPGVRVDTSGALGVDVDFKEAIAFSLIGWLSAHGLPGALPSATGSCGPRILGTITPGHEPLRLPQPRLHLPQRLHLTGRGV